MSANELALGPLVCGDETTVYDSSDDEIEPDGYETDISSIADEPKPDPIKWRIERSLEKLVFDIAIETWLTNNLLEKL